ncbi:MAG: winged helix-turn-helix transcriptional regulator [Flavobacteriales bacterium]|nr:winged helix-turn-helix transcriptional regulator [Flavobacteriales bacterium]
MGATRTDLFTVRQNQLATMAKALGHPARIAILQRLLKQRTCQCGSLSEEIGLAQATISQHLAELKAVGLIKGTVEGTAICYCLDTATWRRFRSMLGALIDQEPKLDSSCC